MTSGSSSSRVAGPDLRRRSRSARARRRAAHPAPLSAKAAEALPLPARTYEWQSWMRLDQTVVPWTTLWLFYFEEWLASDDWKGGGMHPETRRSDHEEAA